ncbi:hypothetical protein ACRRTK_003583 [Alexandromys fortis]
MQLVLRKTRKQSIGCDDFLGSDKVVDKCGVCGGDNTGCQVVSGVFKHALTSLGYHRVVEIPQGATKINITEMHKSNNYLAEISEFGAVESVRFANAVMQQCSSGHESTARSG